MAQVSNPAALSSVASVFLGSNNFSAYNRGGSYVKNINTNSGVATSAHRLSQFSGLAHPVIALPVTADDQAVGTPTTAIASISYQSTGGAESGSSGSGTWLLSGTNTNYEIMFNPTFGNALYSGTVNTWLSLGSTQTWTLRATAGQITNTTGHIAIRDTLNNVELANAAFSLAAEST